MYENSILEAARSTPVYGEYDLCVLGGSCTGVFAAVRAARLGLSVALIERMGSFGGVATLSMVNIWHSPLDECFEKQIFAGLSTELIERLQRRDAVTVRENDPNAAWVFNSSEMQIELDELVDEHKITPLLHTVCVAPHIEDGELTAILVENKSGRSAIKARFFIDATGDGDLCQRLGIDTYLSCHRQPSTTCALFDGISQWDKSEWQELILKHGHEYNLPEGFSWGCTVPGSDLFMFAGTRVYDDCSTAEGFTQAEIEGRRQIRAIQDLLRKYAPEHPITLQALPARIGIRETRHIRSHYHLTGEDLLNGRKFPDAIAYGSYRVDIHHDDKPGLIFRYLDGREIYMRPGHPPQHGRWRPEQTTDPTYYQIPYRSLVPRGPYGNVLAAGRFIDADEQAHGAIRVMVNMNQTGEAAGVAAFIALKENRKACDIDVDQLRSTLSDGGSIML
ncbi:FAD-dependent oxidoreductase [Coraliomargarita parva]|uniref:FAD-dependent oxidoreductase n=1 Tax=Coraliomargarita parva TaxID=3014050 RepID=UPI0022B3719F|nr:FAD-dependent oxidoreductase [Coraliomargarita parva]